MAHILNFDPASSRNRERNRGRFSARRDARSLLVGELPRKKTEGTVSNDYWPEVACGLWMKQPAIVNPENTLARVLTEMAMVLGGAGLLVVLTMLFFGMPYA